MPKKSNFITDSEVPDGYFFDTFGNGVNRKISKENLFAQIKKQAQTYYYDSEDDLKAANLEADPDNPIYVRVAPSWRLYRITSLAPVSPYDIALNNGATATLDRLESLQFLDVDDMVNAPYLKTGDIVHTAWLDEFGDNGGNAYEIGVFGAADGVLIIDLAFNGLQARRINIPIVDITYRVFNTKADMESDPTLFVGQRVRTLGYNDIGDGGGNDYEIVAAATGTDDGGSFIDLSGSGLQARGLFETGQINVKQFGAKGDQLSDDSNAFQNAVNFCIDKNAALNVNSGIFNIKNIDPGNGATIKGDGDSSIIYLEEGTGSLTDPTANNAFVNTSGSWASKGDLIFDKLLFQGTKSSIRFDTGGVPIFCANYSRVEITNCTFRDTTSKGPDIRGCGSILYKNCKFFNISRGPIGARDCNAIVVDGCYMRGSGDDAMSLHTSTQFFNINGVTFTSGIIVQNNHLEDTFSIKAIGGRGVNISNNVVKRAKISPILVYLKDGSPADSEGGNSMYDVVVSGNILEDSHRADNATNSPYVIQVSSLSEAIGDASTDFAPVYRYSSTLGRIVTPWDVIDKNFVDDGVRAPLCKVVISDNIITRTLPAVANYSDWGYGESVSQGGEIEDYPVTDSDLRPSNGISVTGSLSQLSITGNIIHTAQTGITFSLWNTTPAVVDVSKNITRDITNFGAGVSNADTMAHLVTIKDNIFDVDTFRLNANSNIDGSYSVLGNPTGIFLEDAKGAIIEGNSFSNCNRIFHSNGDQNRNIIRGNVAYGDVSVLGWNAANKGIGEFTFDNEAMIKFISVDADPTSSTYMDYTGGIITFSNTFPTSGEYVRGAFVMSNSRTIVGGNYFVMGWDRLTTGSNHVLGTDWAERRVYFAAP